MGNEAVGHACRLFRFEEQNPAAWCDRASCRLVSKQLNQLHNAESQMERKMTLIRRARFSWVTELVLTSRRRGQLWLQLLASEQFSHIELFISIYGWQLALQPAIVRFGDLSSM